MTSQRCRWIGSPPLGGSLMTESRPPGRIGGQTAKRMPSQRCRWIGSPPLGGSLMTGSRPPGSTSRYLVSSGTEPPPSQRHLGSSGSATSWCATPRHSRCRGEDANSSTSTTDPSPPRCRQAGSLTSKGASPGPTGCRHRPGRRPWASVARDPSRTCRPPLPRDSRPPAALAAATARSVGPSLGATSTLVRRPHATADGGISSRPPSSRP
mmetsp:Transcript_69457/g.193258  ORF Transcript_69457/g.193258 Transcript_69457/m.193258 type:complete len:210 (-) Transcript_69457:2472-3101(-)